MCLLAEVHLLTNLTSVTERYHSTNGEWHVGSQAEDWDRDFLYARGPLRRKACPVDPRSCRHARRLRCRVDRPAGLSHALLRGRPPMRHRRMRWPATGPPRSTAWT